MGNVEHTLLCQGRTIENHTQHGKLRGDASTSVGFCFGFGDENDAVHQSRFLKGIVTMQWLMVAEKCGLPGILFKLISALGNAFYNDRTESGINSLIDILSNHFETITGSDKDLWFFVEQKMKYNELRPKLNGKRY